MKKILDLSLAVLGAAFVFALLHFFHRPAHAASGGSFVGGAQFLPVAFTNTLGTAAYSNSIVFQRANANLTNLANGTLTANSATVTNRFLSGTSNAAPGGLGGTNVVLDARAANFFVVTATTNLYFTNLANLTTGYTAVVHLLQDGTGGRSVTFDTNRWKLGTNPPTFVTNANAWQVLTLVSCPHGTNVGVAATTRLR